MRFSAYDLESRFEYVAWSWFLYGIPLVFYLISSLYVHYGGISSFTINTIIYQDPWRSITAFGVIVDLLVLNSFVALCMPLHLIYYSRVSRLRTIFQRIGTYFVLHKKFINVSGDEWCSVRLYLLKLFFVPLVLYVAIDILSKLFLFTGKLFDISKGVIVDTNSLSILILFSVCLLVLLFIDIFFFIIGYLFESPLLNNQIRSVDASLSGWLVCLLSYYPFWLFTEILIGSPKEFFVVYANQGVAVVFSLLILLFMAIHVWATVALGFKASNLTNRGIVVKGPYAYVRHPAYVAKNMAWTVASFHLLLYIDYKFYPTVILTILFLAALYIARAITEERHLSQDADYKEYIEKVPYRFIPRIL